MSNNSVDNQFLEIDLLHLVQTYHNNMAEILRLGNYVIESNRSVQQVSPSHSPSLLPLLRTIVSPIRQRHPSSSTQTVDPLIGQRDMSSYQWIQQLLENYTDASYSFYVHAPETTTTPRRLTTMQIIDNIRTFAYKDNMANNLMDVVCPISQCNFKEDDILCELNRCKHVFKQEDIFRWLNQHTNCPVCRTEIVENESIQTTSAIRNTPNSRTNETDRLGENLENILNETLQSMFSRTT